MDDDQSCIHALKACLASFPFIEVIGEVNSAAEAFAFLKDHEVELAFLDIEMEGTGGIELASHLEESYPSTMVIFVTGYPNFALQGYEVHPVDFLTKPVNIYRLKKALKKVLERLSDKPKNDEQKIGLNIAGGIKMINVNDILYIEKRGRQIWVVCRNNETFLTKDPLRKLESFFKPFNFYRSHQSFIVPIKRIKAIRPDNFSRSYSIILNDNETSIPLSRTNYHELKDLLEKEAKGLTIN